MDTQQIWIILMHNKTFCRVCGYDMGYPTWGENGQEPTYEICPCCGIEFGYEDATIKGIRQARQKWIDNGMKWFDMKEKPEKWNPLDQMKNIQQEYL